MIPLIIVRPDPGHRIGFAQWAVAQEPQVRTCSETEFAVPPHLFTEAPEELLIGATVDGHLYRHVEPDADAGPDAIERDSLEAEQPPSQAGLHLCEDCDKVSTSAAGLAAHRRAKHPE